MTDLPRLPGRQAEAARNDQRILDAARAVFLGDPAAPISAVAERAGVGIGALYRRYRSKEELLARLYADNLTKLLALAQRALDDDGDLWEVFCRYLHDSLDVGIGTISARFFGTFPLSDPVRADIATMAEIDREIFARVHAAGVLRPDVSSSDVLQVQHLVQRLRYADEQRSTELRHRYLSLFLAGAHADATLPLRGEPLESMEFANLLDPQGVWSHVSTAGLVE